MSREFLYAIVKEDHTPESLVTLYTKEQALQALRISAMRMGDDAKNPLEGAGVYRVLAKIEAPQAEEQQAAQPEETSFEPSYGSGEALPADAALALVFTGVATALAVGIKTKSPVKALAVLATFGAAAAGLSYMDTVLTQEYANAPARAPEPAPTPAEPDTDVKFMGNSIKVRVRWLNQPENAIRSGDAIDLLKRWTREARAKEATSKPNQP